MKDEGQTMQDAMRQFADPGGELWIGDVMAKLDLYEALARQLRADSIRCSTTAGSGHPTSSLSAAEAGDADRIHVDVMDGHFVSNLTIGPVAVRSLRRVTRRPLEAHLMIAEPDRYLEAFADAGIDGLTVHVEGVIHFHRTLGAIAKLGKRVGVALNPATPVAALDEVLPELDVVLVMTVDPGFGGQDFIAATVPKIRRVRAMLDRLRPACELEVDGGIHAETTAPAVGAGAHVLVPGSAIFEAPAGVRTGMARLRASVAGAP